MQITQNVPASRQYIRDAVTERNDIASQSLHDQWEQLILRPLLKLDEHSDQSTYVLVIDALDECDNNSNIRIIISLLAKARCLKTTRLRIFLTSRPEIPIRNEFQQILDTQHRDFVLHNISPSIIDHDISIFFEYSLNLIGQEHALDVYWPGEEVLRRLIQIADGLFIWAATACRFIQEGFLVDERVQILLEGNTSIHATEEYPEEHLEVHPEKHLDELYTTILKKSFRPGYSAREKEKFYGLLRSILGSIVVFLSPLSANSLRRLLNITKHEIDLALNDLHAILNIPKVDSYPLRLHHPSFRYYLLSKKRCKDPDLWVDKNQAHQTLADYCIRLMSTSLKPDICEFDAPGILMAEVERSIIDQNLPPEVQYACLYWIKHVQKSGAQLCDDGQVHRFLQKHLLHWLEALGWMGKVSEGVHAIVALQSFATSDDCPNLSHFIHDAKRFVLYNRSIIEQAPIQTYCSALIFVPTTSIVRKQFADCTPKWIEMLPRVEENWNALLQTLEGHSDPVLNVAFSPDGKTLASASLDRMVKLWDARSGVVLQKLMGHSPIAFSLDSKTLASAFNVRTVQLWDAGSGVVLQTLEDHSSYNNDNYIRAIAFLPDGKTLASASSDQTVKLWDARSGIVLQTLKSCSASVQAVAISLDGKTLASASYETVKLWDADVVLQTLEGHSGSVCAIAFSPDGKTLASASLDRTVKLWDARSGAMLQTLEGHLDQVLAVAFSPDGKMLASASEGRIVKIWDAVSGVVLQTLKDHSSYDDEKYIRAVAFSPDSKILASASGDPSVKLWDARSGIVLQTLDRHSSYNSFWVVAFSPDGKMLASASDDQTVRLWDAGSGVVLQTLEGHFRDVWAMAFSPDGKTLASASDDQTVKLWDAGSGVVLQTFNIGYTADSISFSDDSTSLLTDKGILPLSSFASDSIAPLPSQIATSVHVKDQWVSLRTDRILWLPPEYRPSCVAVSRNVVALGHISGRVTLMAFNDLRVSSTSPSPTSSIDEVTLYPSGTETRMAAGG
ncbi:hypothetical protein GJ744_010533 [Endocarpon pusillum]|uniref:Nephrocystin 3-like N-terminal domain-containing protein n=1 Tax=Endocarpon pusillum TaxID=364733 RepID=A0A8H7ARV6_9EURO|nr:hypothetical protein GJ744_010533 [Endocarpon pusillum]